MSLDFTRQSMLRTLLYFALLATIFWGAELFHPNQRSGLAAVTHVEQIVAPTVGMPLGILIDNVVWQIPGVVMLLSSILVFVNAVFITRIVIQNVIFLERTFMPSIVYLLISSCYYNSTMSFRPLLVTFLTLLAIQIMIRSYSYKSLATGAYLVAGFILGTAGAIYVPALFMVALLPVGLIVFRLFSIKEWIAAIGGWGLAMFFNGYGVWLAGGEFLGLISDCREMLITQTPLPSLVLFSSFEWTFVGSIVILFILSIVTFIGRRRSYKLRAYKVYMFFIFMLVISVLALVLVPCRSLYQLPMLAVPLAVIIPTYFNSREPNFISNFLYLMMVVCAVVIHILPFFL